MAESTYPRALRQRERELLEWVLPLQRPGYRALRELIAARHVVGEGKRGAGNLVMGLPGDVADASGRTTPVIAYGVVETTNDRFTVVVRDEAEGQIDIEIVSARGDEVPEHFEEKRRWTLSDWVPGLPSPMSGGSVRQIDVGDEVTLAIAPGDRRLWVYEGRTGIVRPLPVTNFYNELMLVMRIREPSMALRSDRLFDESARYSDENLRAAFLAYNALLPKVRIDVTPVPRRPVGFIARLRRRVGL